MQVCGSDPVLIAVGSRQQKLRFSTVVLLFWAALGFNLSWKEGQEGPKVEWIGGGFSLLQDGEAKTRAAKDGVGEVLHVQAVLPEKSWCHLPDTCR